MKYYLLSLLLLLIVNETNATVEGEKKGHQNFILKIKQGEHIRIAAMGTSLTGGTWCWFDVMKEWLDTDYPGQLTYFNEGVGASASSYPPEVCGLVKVKVVAEKKPDVVFIEFAVNDSYKPYHISVEESRENLQSMINTLREANPYVEIILQTMNVVIDVPEQNMTESTKRADILKYLEMYREVAKENNILLIDHYPNWEKFLKQEGRDAYLEVVTDGIHPNLEGYRKILLPEMKRVLLGTLVNWLPEEVQSSSISPEVDDFLTALNGQIRLLHCQYDGSKLVAKTSFSEKELRIDDALWSCNVNSTPVNKDKQVMELDISFKLDKGMDNSAGVAVAFDFANWSADNYVMIPASVYNGNRNRIVTRDYAAGLDRTDLYRKDLQLTTTDLPHLSSKMGESSKIEVLACNATTPAICFYNKKNRRAFILLAEQGVRVGNSILDNGLIVEESPDRTRASLILSAPGVRERKPEFIGFSKSPDRGIDWKTGDELTMHLRLYSFETSGIPGLFEKFMSVRKTVTGVNHPRTLIPFSEITRLMTNNIDNRFYSGKDNQFYCPENANWISFGWIGGLMNTFPMLALGDELHRERVISTFDFAIPKAQGKSGYFYGALNYDGKCFGREGYDEFPEICLTRKNGDVLFWMIKQFELLKAQGKANSINPVWETNIKRLAQAFVDTWKKNGQWGNFVNNETGEVAVYNTSSGVSAIGGLALASGYYKNPEFMQIAKEAAEFYYNRDFVKLGMTTGACADILQNADSETAAGFMTSLMAIYELTDDAKWLEMSRNLANLCATWTVSYDYELPSNTELAQLGAKLTGVVWASTQNKHGAPGFCTSSGDPLFRIYRATGDLRYAELMRDVVRAHAEGVQPNGLITERLTYCDADSRGSRGTGGKTGWNELNGILMAMEIPGIYLQTDAGEFYVFDHVEAEVVKRDKNGVILKITNPTEFNANVAIFAETAEQALNPFGYTAFIHWPKVEVKKGESGLFRIRKDGKIIKLS